MSKCSESKRSWIVATQMLIAAALTCVGLSVHAERFFQLTLAFFWIMAFSSATQDIAADGFYMLVLPNDLQAAFIGVRTAFYRLATIAAQGGLVILAGFLEYSGHGVHSAWSLTFLLVAVLFVALCLYHYLILPYPQARSPCASV